MAGSLIIGWIYSFAVPWLWIGRRWLQDRKSLAGGLLITAAIFGWLAYLAVYVFAPVTWPVALAVHFVVLSGLSWIAGRIKCRSANPHPLGTQRLAFKDWRNNVLGLGLTWYLLILLAFSCGGVLLLPGGFPHLLKPSLPQWLLTQSLLGVPVGLALGTYATWRGRAVSARHLLWSALAAGLVPLLLGLPSLAYGLLLYWTGAIGPVALSSGVIRPIELYGNPQWTAVLGQITMLLWMLQLTLAVGWLTWADGVRSFRRRSLGLLLVSGFAWTNLMCVGNHQAALLTSAADRLLQETATPARQRWALRLYRAAWNRCPDSDQGGRVALRIAELAYRQGNVKEATRWYRLIVTKYQTRLLHRYAAEEALLYLEAISSSPSGRWPSLELPLPVIQHETYTDANWLACLSVIRFWEPDADESAFKLKLQAVSTKEEQIALPPLAYLADLQRVMPSLGYEPVFLQGSLEELIGWLRRGIPVLIPMTESMCNECVDHGDLLADSWNSLLPMVGWDAQREAVGVYNYGPFAKAQPIQLLTRQQARELVEVPARLQPLSKAREQSIRQALLTYFPRQVFEQFWATDANAYVLLLPQGRKAEVLQGAGVDRKKAERQTRWLTQFSLGKALYDRGFDLPALEAFLKARDLSTKNLLPAWYLGLAALRLEGRSTNPGLEGLSPLAVEAWSRLLKDRTTAQAIEAGKAALHGELETRQMRGAVLREYADLLARRYAERRADCLKAWELLRDRHPVAALFYDQLARFYEDSGDLHKQITALRALHELTPHSPLNTLRLASALLDDGRVQEASRTLAGLPKILDRGLDFSYRTPAIYVEDHPMFHKVMGQLLIERKRFAAAARHLRLAVLGRPSSAQTHYAYGRALEELGRRQDAVREFRWAAVCDVSGHWGKAAQDRLTRLQEAP